MKSLSAALVAIALVAADFAADVRNIDTADEWSLASTVGLAVFFLVLIRDNPKKED